MKKDNLIPTTFELGQFRYKGVHDPSVTWNGFAVPYFEEAVAYQMLNDMEIFWTYNFDGDTIITVYDEEFEQCDGMYSIGGMSWAWSVVDPTPSLDDQIQDVITQAAQKIVKLIQSNKS